MRLLVHGGTSYNERQRIGVWPSSILSGTLEDTYCLSQKSFAFGVGLQGGDPFLIARTLISHQGRPYALSILLDPGLEIWESFRWNGAHLALALFGLTASPGHLLVVHPEAFSSTNELKLLLQKIDGIKDIKGLLERLKKVDLLEACPPHNFLDLLVGAGSIHTSEIIVAAPGTLGLPTGPMLAEAAVYLNHIPECFRIGEGWLIGGGKIHGEVFGARFVLDEGMAANREASSQQVISAFITNGHELIDACNIIEDEISKKGESYGENWIKASGTPVRDWEKLGLASREAMYEDLFLHADLVKAEKPAEDILPIVIKRLDRKGPLDQAIRHALGSFLEKIFEGGNQLSPNLTSFILSLSINYGVQITEQVALLLDPRTVVEEVISGWHKTSAIADILPKLRADDRFKVWSGLISGEGKIIKLLGQALESLRGKNDQDAASYDNIRAIISDAIKRSTTLKLPLSEWKVFENNKDWPTIEAELMVESHRRAESRVGNWPRDYLYFGNDAGGIELDKLIKDSSGVHEMVAWLCGEKDKDIAQEWLKALAGSPLRKKVPIVDKVRLTTLNIDEWQTFKKLNNIYNGERNQTLMIKAEERDYLLDELHKLVERDRGKEGIEFVPNLKRLEEAFPDVDLTFFKDLQINNLSWANQQEWLDVWKRLDDEVYQRELMQLLRKDEKPIPAYLQQELFKDLSKENLSDLFVALLFDRSVSDNKCCKRIGELFDNYREDTQFKNSVDGAFKRCFSDQSKREILLQRYRDSKVQQCLSESLSPGSQKRLEKELDEQKKHQLQNKKAAAREEIYRGDNIKKKIEEILKGDEKDTKRIVTEIIEEERAQPAEWHVFLRRFASDRAGLNIVLAYVPKELAESVRNDILQHKGDAANEGIYKLLYEGPPVDDESCRRMLVSKLDPKETDEATLDAIAILINEHLRDEKQSEVFYRRFGRDESFLDKLFRAIPQIRRFTILHFRETEPERFEDEVYRVLERFQELNKPLKPYGVALLGALRYESEMNAVKQRVLKRYEGAEYANPNDSVLDEILSDYSKEIAEFQDANDSTNDQSPSSVSPEASDAQESNNLIERSKKILMKPLSRFRNKNNNGSGVPSRDNDGDANSDND